MEIKMHHAHELSRRSLAVVTLAAIVAAAMSDAALGASKGIVLVAGATGRTGRPLIKILKARGYEVRAMVRGEATAAELGADEIVKADVTTPATLPAAVKGASYVISTMGSTPEVDDAGLSALVDAAKAAGVKQFILMSSVGAEITDPNDPSVRRGEILIAKGKGEKHLRQSGLAYTIVRPGGLLICDEGKSGISLGRLSAAENKAAHSAGICRADVAMVMAETLGNRDAQNKTFTLVGAPDAPLDAWRSQLAALKKD